MKSDSGKSVSSWMQAALPAYGQPLPSDLESDVCVIGAGIAGLSTAYLLAREGRSVVVLDDGPVGGGETGRTSAHLSSAIDDGFVRIEELHGAEGAQLAYQSHGAAIDRIEAIAREEGIECAFERVEGLLFAAPGRPEDELSREFAAARRAGARVEFCESSPLAGLALGACLRYANQAQMHPLEYLAGLAEAFTRQGGRIHCGAHVVEVEDGEPVRIRVADGRSLRARSVVVAAQSPFTLRFAIHTKQAPYRTFVVAAACPAGSLPHVLLWDTADPYHYVRVEPARDGEAHDLLLVGGEDYKTGQADDGAARYERLEAWMRDRFPEADEVLYRWSGQVLETLDGLAYIGREPGQKHVYLATGDSGMGLTHGTIAGMLLTDLILGRPNAWSELYAPDRKPVRAARQFLRENLNVAAQFADYAKPGEVASVDDIPNGSGAIVRRGVHRVAAYRDEHGELHERSAVCTHLGCSVHWNSGEATWDCPCHGSRFDTEGRVVNGPAYQPLAEVKPTTGTGIPAAEPGMRT